MFIIVDKNKIIELYNKGFNSSDISKELNIGRTTVYKYLKENNLKSHNKKPLSPRKISEKDITKIIELYNNGLSLEKIKENLKLELDVGYYLIQKKMI